MASATVSPELTLALHNKATQLRIDSIRATTEAGSGHPSSCCSAADIVATLFFSVMRYDPKNPKAPNSDRFVLSKGHAAPLLYAAWAEAGLFPKSDLLKLRTLSSDLEGHPTPRLSFVDMATGSLGQGLPVGIGIALNAKFVDKMDHRTYVLMGDGESIEGSNWEAAEVARHHALDNLCAIIDVNRLGQSDPTMLQHDMEGYRARWAGFGWHAIVVDGHDLAALVGAFDEAARTKGKPTVILAKTFKGRGVSFMEDSPSWHGKPIPKGEETQKAIDELTKQIKPGNAATPTAKPNAVSVAPTAIAPLGPSPYKPGDSAATREAFGLALEALGSVNSSVVGLDADVKNSTYTDKFGDPLHPFPAFTASVANVQPTSRGSIRLKSADPAVPPAIQPNYLSTDDDRRVAAGPDQRRYEALAGGRRFERGDDVLDGDGATVERRERTSALVAPSGCVGAGPGCTRIELHERAHGALVRVEIRDTGAEDRLMAFAVATARD